MNEECVSDLESQVQTYAYNAVIDPSTQDTRTNLTNNSVYDVCEDIRLNLLANFPSSCEIFFNQSFSLNISGSGRFRNDTTHAF